MQQTPSYTSISPVQEPARRLMMISPHFEEYSLRLGSALSAGAEVLLATDVDRLRRDYADRALPNVPRLHLRNVAFRSPLDALKLLAAILRFRPSVIHFQEPSGSRKAIICAAVVLVVRPFCRVALTVHDPQPHLGRDSAVAERLRLFRSFIRRAAKTVFVHGPYCRDAYREVQQRPGQRVVVVDHGEILADAEPAPPLDQPLSIYCFGRMEAYKGLAVLSDALKLLHERGVDPRVLITGSGPELDRLIEEFDRLPNVSAENVFVSSKRLISELRDADCVVMPYLEATQSGVLAAAMANGRFVIASRVGGIPDIVEDEVNGLLVPPGDSGALAAAIERVTHDRDLRRRLTEGARRTGAGRLKWSHIAPKFLANY